MTSMPNFQLQLPNAMSGVAPFVTLVRMGVATCTNSAMSEPHVVVIGGGFGGLSACRVLRNTRCESRCSTGATTTCSSRCSIRWQRRRSRPATSPRRSAGSSGTPANVRVLLGEAARVDVAARRVELSDGDSVDYDYLIVATGASHTYFGHPEWEPYAPGLKTLEDALEIRPPPAAGLRARGARNRSGAPAGAADVRRWSAAAQPASSWPARSRRSRGRRCATNSDPSTPAPRASSWSRLDQRSWRRSRRSCAMPRARRLRRLRVEVREDARRVTGDRRARRSRSSAGAERLDAGTVLWAAGVAASPLVADAWRAARSRRTGARRSRTCRFPVIRRSSSSAMPRVLQHQDGQPLPGVAQVAMQQAAHAARGILRGLRGDQPVPFVYRDLGNLAIIGRGSAIADLGGWSFPDRSPGCSGCSCTSSSSSDSAIASSCMLQWALAYVTFQRSVRLITGTTKSTKYRPRSRRSDQLLFGYRVAT